MGKSRKRKCKIYLPFAVLFLFIGYLAWETDTYEGVLTAFLRIAIIASGVLGASFVALVAIYTWWIGPPLSRKKRRRPAKVAPPEN